MGRWGGWAGEGFCLGAEGVGGDLIKSLWKGQGDEGFNNGRGVALGSLTLTQI